MILGLFRRRVEVERAEALYAAIVPVARAPWLFAAGGTPDTREGRFDSFVLHVFLVLRRLKGQGPDADLLSQALFDHFFKDMDAALRELGVGDTTIGKKIKAMSEVFYGRAKAYGDALDAGDEGALRDALDRNLFAGVAADPTLLEAVVRYVVESDAALSEQPLESLLNGDAPNFAQP